MKVKLDRTEAGEPFLLVPEKVLKDLQIKDGDLIEWVGNQYGSWTIRKAESQVEGNVEIHSVESALIHYPELKTALIKIYGKIDLGKEWLTSDIPALGGQTPLERIQNGDIQSVLMALKKMEYGEYS